MSKLILQILKKIIKNLEHATSILNFVCETYGTWGEIIALSFFHIKMHLILTRVLILLYDHKPSTKSMSIWNIKFKFSSYWAKWQNLGCWSKGFHKNSYFLLTLLVNKSCNNSLVDNSQSNSIIPWSHKTLLNWY